MASAALISWRPIQIRVLDQRGVVVTIGYGDRDVNDGTWIGRREIRRRQNQIVDRVLFSIEHPQRHYLPRVRVDLEEIDGRSRLHHGEGESVERSRVSIDGRHRPYLGSRHLVFVGSEAVGRLEEDGRLVVEIDDAQDYRGRRRNLRPNSKYDRWLESFDG